MVFLSQELMSQQELTMHEQRRMKQKEMLQAQEIENLAMVEQVFGFLPDDVGSDTINTGRTL